MNYGQSTYEAVNESPYIDSAVWTLGDMKDADAELTEYDTLQKLRMVSSKLVKNSFFGQMIIQAYANAVLGGETTVKIHYPSERIEKELNDRMSEKLSALDINKTQSLQDILEQIVTGSCERGDILINLVGDGGTFYVELIEASRIRTPIGIPEDEKLLVREGVKYNKSGKIVSYYVRKPMDTPYTFVYDDITNYIQIPAYQNVNGVSKRTAFLFLAPINQRPNQSRQVPLLTPLMGLLRYTAQYFEALMISVRVAACFVGVMRSDNPAGTKKNLEETGNKFSYVPLKPGTLMQTDGKGDVTFASPNRPSDNVDDFLKRIGIFIGGTLRMPYTYVFLDTESTNYSSWRGGNIETKRTASRWTNRLWYIVDWIVMNKLKEIRTEFDFSIDKCKTVITFPQFASLDEEKTARSEKINLDSGTDSVQNICLKKGMDYEALQKELLEHKLVSTEQQAEVLKRQKELEKEYGIVFIIEQKSGSKSSSDLPSDLTTDPTSQENAKEKRKQDGNW